MFIEYQLRNFRTFELRLRYGVEVQQMNPDIVNTKSVIINRFGIHNIDPKVFSTQIFVPYKLEGQKEKSHR